MINILLEKKIELQPDENVMELTSPLKLEYYLIESKLEDMDELSGQKVYGIEIVKKIDGMNDEKEVVRNFSCCIEKAKSVFEKMVNNYVTPMSLFFIIDDIIGV